MPKDLGTHKRRKRRSKGKIPANLIVCPRLPDPGEPSTSLELISEMHLSNPVKNEGEVEKSVCYPDTRFPQSTTLFPAGGVEGNSRMSGSLRETFKRNAEDKISTISKKVKVVTDSTKAIEDSLTDDCVIIEESPKKVKIEVVDLADDSNSSRSILCCPVRTKFPKNRKPNTTLKGNGDIRVKVESDEKTCEMNTDIDMKYIIQDNSKENKASKHADATTHKICLKSELGIVNGDNRGIGGQVRVTNTVSVSVLKNATDSTISGNYMRNDVPIKVERNKNCVVGDKSTSVPKFTSDVNQTGINSADRPINNEQNKIKQNCEVNDNYMTVPTPPLVFRTEIPSDIPFGTENLPNTIDKQQTEEKVKDCFANCLVNTEEAQQNVVCDNDKKGADSTRSVLTTAQVKKEPEEIDFQEINFNCEKTQHYENISHENTNIGVISSETLISNDTSLRNISPIAHSGMSSGDSQLYESGTIRTPFLKYMNLNTKVDLLELSNAFSYLEDMIEVRENAGEDDKLSRRSPLQNMIKSVASLKRSETSNNQPMRKNNHVEGLPSNDVLRQILNTAKPI